MAERMFEPTAEPIEVVPVVVLSQVFPARPSSIPDIRNFVRRCLAESPLTEDGTRQVGETVFRALLDAAGPSGSINVAFRIFPEHVEVDVLHSDMALAPSAPAGGASAVLGGHPAPMAVRAGSGLPRPGPAGSVPGQPAVGPGAGGPGASGPGAGGPGAGGPGAGGEPGHHASFAQWMSSALRREGLTQQAAARQLGVSVKTISRWVGGATEPRLRDLPRIQEVFGDLQLSTRSH